jgi:hypothetical protein
MLGKVLGWLTGSTIGAVAEGVEKVGGVFSANKENQAARFHEADQAILQQFASEFKERSGGTWFDSAVDGLNRLPRPLISLGIIGMFGLAPYDPDLFARVADAWAKMPEGYWILAGIIVTFFFGSRAVLDGKRFQVKTAAVTQAANLISQRKEFRKLLSEDDDGLPDKVSAKNKVVARWQALGRPNT